MPLFGQDTSLFGQDREIGEFYDAWQTPENPNPTATDAIIDLMIMRGMDNDAIEDEIRNIEGMGMLNDMRENSMTGAMGNMDASEVDILMQAMTDSNRKTLTPEQIHNYGVLYGSPLTQPQIDFFEDQLNRDPNQSYMGNPPVFPKG